MTRPAASSALGPASPFFPGRLIASLPGQEEGGTSTPEHLTVPTWLRGHTWGDLPCGLLAGREQDSGCL